MKLRLLCLFALLFLPFVSVRAQNRTVIDKEAGSIFQTPDGFSYSEYGAFVGSAPTGASINSHRVTRPWSEAFLTPRSGRMSRSRWPRENPQFSLLLLTKANRAPSISVGLSA